MNKNEREVGLVLGAPDDPIRRQRQMGEHNG
jgi:hypothetical protein